MRSPCCDLRNADASAQPEVFVEGGGVWVMKTQGLASTKLLISSLPRPATATGSSEAVVQIISC